jgi:3-hydroxyacyl-[acyl-carrier-protein] dehydratase
MHDDILELLPYKSSFRFVDNISLLNKDEVNGDFFLRKNAFFYEDHFAGNPVTPGVIITEIMAQIGLVVLGIYLIIHSPEQLKDIDKNEGELFPLLTSADVSFYKIVLPEQKVTVISKKQYFRFGKLKCKVEMLNENKELLARGIFSGFIKKTAVKK